MKTLITPSDVKQFAVMPLSVNPCSFRELSAIEEDALVACIGESLYRAMLAAVVCYEDVPPHQAGTTYQAGESVYYQGTYRTATQSTDTIPSTAIAWKDMERFTGPCAGAYESLTCNYLLPFLAQVVARQRLPFVLDRIGTTDQDARATQDRFRRYETALSESAEQHRNRLVRFLKVRTNAAQPCYREHLEAEVTHCGCRKSGCLKCGPRDTFHLQFA